MAQFSTVDNNLFPRFPGFRSDVAFHSTLVLDSRSQRMMPSRAFTYSQATTDRKRIVDDAVTGFVRELEYLAENTKVDVLVCALPYSLVRALQPAAADPSNRPRREESSDANAPDFHDVLKARTLNLRVPIQLVLPSTYDETKRLAQKQRPGKPRRSQDEATRAWNLHTALYYKAQGIPWRLVRDRSDYAVCYIGVSFYESTDRTSLLTSVAQVFNERGEGMVVRGGEASVSKDDRQPHLDAESSQSLLANALGHYRAEHKTLPARVVIHKTSGYTMAEIDGFQSAAASLNVEMLDLLSLSASSTRLFRVGSYPPLRGTLLSLDDSSHVLYTKGSVGFFSTYPGMYVPRPLEFHCDHVEQTPRFLGQEILALTKMNWNNTQFDGGEPITTLAAHRVGSILKHAERDQNPVSSYRYYM